MISARTVPRVLRRDNSHTPIDLMFGFGEFVDHAVALIFIEQPEPHRNRSQHAGGLLALAVLVERKGVDVFLWRPERLI